MYNSKYTGQEVENILDAASTLSTDLAGKADASHTHSSADITDLTEGEKKAWQGTQAQYDALASKESDKLYLITDGEDSETTSYDDTEIRGLIEGKADWSHTHSTADITDYSEPTSYDDTEIRGLIEEKADSTHTHSISDIDDFTYTEPTTYTEGTGITIGSDDSISLTTPVVVCTQDEYDALTPDDSTLYFIKES